MKRWLLTLVVLLICSTMLPAAGSKFFLTLHGYYMDIGDNDLTKQYSMKKIATEGKVAVAVFRNIFIWGSYSSFPLRDSYDAWSSKAAFNKDVTIERTVGKHIYSGGVGYYVGYFDRHQLAIKVELGLCSITNQIDSSLFQINTTTPAGNETAKQSSIGLRGNLGATYGLLKNVFGEIAVGYMYATEMVDSTRNNLGGLHLSLGLGINL